MRRSLVLLVPVISLSLLSQNVYCIEEKDKSGLGYYISEYYNQCVPDDKLLESGATNDKSNVKEEAINKDKDTKLTDYSKSLVSFGYYKKDSKDEKLNLRDSILRFQCDHNMKVDGVWGKASQLNLEKRIETGKFFYKDVVRTPPSTGRWIAINKTKRILTLYEGEKVVRKFPIAIGNPTGLTPEGKFRIVNKLINPTWMGGGYAKPIKGGNPNNPLGKRWIGISYKGGGQIGMHGNASPYSIGLNVSHGCIRMINSDVKEYFEMVDISNPVWIGSEDLLKKWGITQEEYCKS